MRSVFLTCGFGKSAGVRSAMRCIEGTGTLFGLAIGISGSTSSHPSEYKTLSFKYKTFGQLRCNSALDMAKARPLRGLKVLDLGNFLAGPVVSMHLGAMGADVIKLERITGDDSRAIGPMAADGEAAG